MHIAHGYPQHQPGKPPLVANPKSPLRPVGGAASLFHPMKPSVKMLHEKVDNEVQGENMTTFNLVNTQTTFVLLHRMNINIVSSCSHVVL